MSRKLKIAVVPGEVCGGCDMALVDLHKNLIDVIGLADIVFWPIAMDFKEEDLDELESIDIALFQGSIRTEKHKEIIERVASKAKIKVAFGACACFGGVQSLADLYKLEEVLNEAYLKSPSTINEERILPGESKANPYKITAPKLVEINYKVDDFIDVDVYVPGCPPPKEIISEAVNKLIKYFEGRISLEKGTVIAGTRTLCDECPREKPEKIVIDRFKRIHEVRLDPSKCFLAQGAICLGPATRGGCGSPCIKANMPCRGCMGPAPNIYDVGAKLVSALPSLVEIENEPKLSDDELSKRVTIMDPAGLFYRFTLGLSRLVRMVRRE
ncbi:MAG: oxidoreductase [Candidatus Korarchaeota archaeon]|nr:oxidoreductase [Thermoproteota archaeon]MCR8462894.1 oxidoreductase [Thermoproteota archaeon]MCR8470366.1 oxidoreductase [Thermoproteota archaeon]MCR8472031.1 oxidoreductase [Thermoproteota archaeon]MCR8472958.1 oxidoreductase [Thermoproteota archaeon]